MKQKCFQLPVSSPTNIYGPDFMLVVINEQDVAAIRAMMDALGELDADGVIVLDSRPEWYRGDPEYAAEEIFASGEDVNLDAFLDEAFDLVRVEGSRMVVTRSGVQWESESAGGDLFRSSLLNIKSLERDLGLQLDLIRPQSEPLFRLEQLIAEGVEFQDALWAVSRHFGLSREEAEQLQQDYDLACALAS